ncbi:MAG: arginine--tRNA ligase, partial [Planctomycetota bacterium]
ADWLHAIPRDAGDDRFGIPQAGEPRRTVIDYSSPNIAKQMHVGHLRSTIIGDVFARVLSFLGHDVIRQNHVGDWGTAMGMVILGLWYIKVRRRRGETIDDVAARTETLLAAKEKPESERRALIEAILEQWREDLRLETAAEPDIDLEQLECGYKFVQALTTAARGLNCRVEGSDGAGEDIAELARKVTAMLQEGGERNQYERAEWEEARRISLDYCQKVYDRLGVLLTRDDVCGESFYQLDRDRLTPVVEEIRARLGPASAAAGESSARVECREDAGALCLYFYDKKGEPRFKNPAGEELPMIIRKSDGAFLYASTDLAAIRYRIEELGGRRLIYVTDARQKLHFEMLFAAARAMGWACDEVQLEHVTFGSVLGSDRKPLKTRSGDNVKLEELLDEAERRARELLEAKERQRLAEADQRSGDALEQSPLNAVEKRDIARRIGVAAVKYADLARDRNSDYVFDWDKMLALQGNTAPYMLYAYARIRSIYRKAAERFGEPDVYSADVAIRLRDPAERALALRLARLAETVETLGADLLPHTLCTYLY